MREKPSITIEDYIIIANTDIDTDVFPPKWCHFLDEDVIKNPFCYLKVYYERPTR